MLRSGIFYCKSACLSSATFVRPTQPIEIFGKISMPFYILAHPLISVQNFMEIVPEKGGKAKGVAKYSDFGPVESYNRKQCKIRPRVQLITNRKSYP